MATGYTKQSTYETGDVISASLFNNDFNALETAFDVTDGHNHDGTVGGGAAIPKIGDADFNNKIEIDSSNNIIKMFVEISTASTEVLNVTGTSLKPLTSSYDLGTSDNRFDTVYSKTINVDSSDNIAQIKLSGSGGTTIFQTVSGGTARLVADALGEQTEASRTLTFNLYDTEKMRIDSTGVGINTDDPQRELEVTGSGNVYARITAPTDNDSAVLELKNTQETWQIRNQDTNDDALEFIDDTATRLTIKKDGKVGIGTTSPNKKLHIKDGDVRIESDFPRLYFTDISQNSDYSIINNNGKFSIYDDTNTTYRMAIDSSGKVGIGTDSPDSKLDVAGEIRADNVIRVQGSGDGRVEVGGATGGYVDLKTPDTDDYDFRLAHTAANGSKLVSPNSDIKISVGNQDRLTIKTDGKVGIGTNSPDAKLHVQGGDIKITSDGDSNANADGIPSIIFTEFNDDHATYSADAAHAVISYHGTDETGDANYLGFGVFDQSVGTENTVAEAKLLTDLNITRNGFVGIGTTEPQAKLHLMAPDCDIIQEMASDSTARLIEHRFTVDGAMQSQIGHHMGVAASEGVDAIDPRFEIKSKHDLWFLGGPTASAPKIAFKNDGKVGIGTTTPAEILDIENTDLANAVTLKVKNLAEATDDTTLPSSELKLEADGVTGTITVEGVGSTDSTLGKVSIIGGAGKPLTFGTGFDEHARFFGGHFLINHEAISTASAEHGIALTSHGTGFFTSNLTANDAVLQLTRFDLEEDYQYISFEARNTSTSVNSTLGTIKVTGTNGDDIAVTANNDLALVSDGGGLKLESSTVGIALLNDLVPFTANTGDISLGTSSLRWNDLFLAGDIDLESDSTDADTQSITFKNATAREAYIRADYSSDASGNGTGLTIATNPNNGTSVERLKVSEDGDITFFAEDGTTSGVFWDASEQTLGIGDYTLTGTDGTSGQALVTDGSGNVAFGDVTVDISGKADLTGAAFTGNVSTTGTLATGGYTLSSTDGTNGQALVTDGSGNVSFGDVTADVSDKADLSGADFTGDITVDTDTLAVDISENKVGVNTAIADLETELHVTASRDGRIITGAGTVATYMLNTSARPGLTLENTITNVDQNEVGLTLKRSSGTAAAAAGIFLEKNTSDYTSGGSLNFYLPRSNVSDHVITMSSHGRLGIGETDPQYPLHVKNVFLNSSETTKIAIRPKTTSVPDFGIIGFESADPTFSGFRAEIVAAQTHQSNTGRSAFKFNVATTTNQASPATALTIGDDIELTPTNDVILRPADGIVMRPQGSEGIEMHWYQQSTGTTVEDDGEQTKRFHITQRGIHVGDDVTGTYTAGDLQDNRDIDFGMLIGRDSDNLGSNNVGIGYQLDFDIDSASNWATGSQVNFRGDTANSVGHGGNLLIGPKFNDTTGDVGIEHSYVGGYLVQVRNDYSFNWAKGNSDNNGVYRASNSGYGCIMMGEEIQISSTCSWSFAGGGLDANGSVYTKLELSNTDYGFVYGRGHDVSHSDYAMVSGRRNDLTYASGSLVAGSYNTVGTHAYSEAAHSLVVGNNNDVPKGSYAFVGGKSNTIENDYGSAIGESNLVEGDHAFTAGKSNNPLGNAAVCLGQGLKTPLFQQLNADNSLSSNYLWDNFVTTVGAYNDEDKKFFTDYPTDSSNPTSWVTNHRFVVGTGTIETVNDAEVITKSTGFVVANEVVDGTDGFCGIIMPALAKSNSNYATEQDAKDGGVPVGGLYHTNGVIKIVQES